MAPLSGEFNFCYPIQVLSNERLKLTPFITSIHASRYFALSSPHPELYAHVPFGPFATEQDFIDEFIQGMVHPNQGMILFAVIDKTATPGGGGSREDNEGVLAGILAYMNTSTTNLSTEIGCVITLPPFQRTHVTSNAVGLLLQYALKLPSDGGLGLRRVQWQTSSKNAASLRTADRFGFKLEGILRWDRVFHDGHVRSKVHSGRELPVGRGNDGDYARDTAILSFCWDDWEAGGKEKVEAIMKRQ